MKKIIDGKRYDTETATKIASYDNGYYGNDFRSMQESLYKTPRGNYFLAGSGGAMSNYAECHGDMSGSGSGVIPIGKQEAIEWLEATDNDESIEEYFWDCIEEG